MFVRRIIPEAVPPGPARRQPVPQLPPGREDNAVVRLHARQPPRPAPHLSAPHVGRLGSRPGPESGTAAEDAE